MHSEKKNQFAQPNCLAKLPSWRTRSLETKGTSGIPAPAFETVAWQWKSTGSHCSAFFIVLIYCPERREARNCSDFILRFYPSGQITLRWASFLVTHPMETLVFVFFFQQSPWDPFMNKNLITCNKVKETWGNILSTKVLPRVPNVKSKILVCI